MGKRTKGLRFAEFTGRSVGRPYKLGETDCLSLVLSFLDHAGVEIPDSFDGVTRENYPALYRVDPRRAKEILLRWITTVGEEIPPSHAFTGDILVVRVKGKEDWGIEIHAGGDLALGAFAKQGIGLETLRGYDILKAYRIRHNSNLEPHAPCPMPANGVSDD